MTLLYIDGFDLKDIDLRYVTLNSGFGNSQAYGTGVLAGFSTTVSVTGSQAWRNYLRSVTASSALYWGARMRFRNSGANFGGTHIPFLSFATDAAVSQQVYLSVTPTGALNVYRGNPWVSSSSVQGTLLGSSAAAVVPVDGVASCYLEVNVIVASGTGGSVVVKVNGVTVINLTGQNTKNTGTSTNIDGIYHGAVCITSTGSPSADFDDMYVCNSAGSVNNNFLGDVRVQTLSPTGAGSSTQFAPVGSGSNYANVNDVPDSTATYNADSVSGHRDTYAMADLVSGTGTILGVQQVTHAFKSDAGVSQLKAAQKSGATISYGATRSLATSNTFYADLNETNPASSVAYTISEVNALEAGAEVV